MKKNIDIVSKSNFWFSISGSLVVLAIVALLAFGLNFGIDFTGGSLLEVQYGAGQRPEVQAVKDSLADVKSLTVQPTDNNGLILRFQDTEEGLHQSVLEKLQALTVELGVEGTAEESAATISPITIEGDAGQAAISLEGLTTADGTPIAINTETASAPAGFEELRFEAVGPAVGTELRTKAVYSLILVLGAIILYVAWAFRKVSKPVASWKYGLASIVALFHDVIITLGVFAVLGRFWGVEINSAFVAAILMVLGYSVNDTIVVFDRVRENLPKSELDFAGTVNRSLNQTFARSLNTSITTLLVLLSIVVLGGVSIRYFALALFIGVFFGTFSSIFLASPLLVWFEKLKK